MVLRERGHEQGSGAEGRIAQGLCRFHARSLLGPCTAVCGEMSPLPFPQPSSSSGVDTHALLLVAEVCLGVGSKIVCFIYLFLLFLFIYVCIFGCGGSLLLCAGFLFSCSKRGLLSVAVRGPLIVVASRYGAWALGVRASVAVARGLSSCGSRALERRLSSCGSRA